MGTPKCNIPMDYKYQSSILSVVEDLVMFDSEKIKVTQTKTAITVTGKACKTRKLTRTTQ